MRLTPRLQRLVWAGRVAVALALVGYLVWHAGVLQGIAFADISWAPLVAAAAVVPIAIAVRALSLMLVTNRRERVLTAAETLHLTYLGAGLALVLPPGAADAAKAHLGYRRHGNAEALIVAAVIDKLTSVAALCAMALAGALALGDPLFALVAAAGLLVALAPIAAPRLVPWRLALRALAPGHAADDDALHAVSRLGAGRAALVCGVSVVGWTLTFVVQLLALLAVGAGVSLAAFAAIAPVAALARIVPISAGGVGLGEVALVALLERASVPGAVASEGALLALLLVVLIPGAVGLVLLATSRYQRASATSQGNDRDSSTRS